MAFLDLIPLQKDNPLFLDIIGRGNRLYVVRRSTDKNVDRLQVNCSENC